MARIEGFTYVGEVENMIDDELEDFIFRLFNKVSDEEISRDEFHEVYFLHGGWADPRDFVLSVLKDCGLEW